MFALRPVCPTAEKKNIFVISTDKRPVPLQHFLWCRQKLYQIMDGATGRFLPEGFKAAKTEGITDKNKALQKRGIFKKPSLKQAKSSWVVLISYLQKQELLPVVIFAFSKKVCEDCAYGMYNMDLTTSAEKSEVTTLVSNSLNRLQVVDRKLPQVLRVRELARRGIGLHHAGMLPILKEIIELLFSRGLIKVLFATETFAMGVNMPTKTVVFYALRKHDGQEFRELRPGEYTQMSGRAGRRGLDKFGIVIINSKNDEPPDELSVKQMLMGKATKLESRFRLTYNMILNLLRQEDMKGQWNEKHCEACITESEGGSLAEARSLSHLCLVPSLHSGGNDQAQLRRAHHSTRHADAQAATSQRRS